MCATGDAAGFGIISKMSANPDENSPRVIVDLTQVLAEVPSRIARIEADVAHMKGDLGKLETGQEKLRVELRADINGLRVELRWLMGIVVTGFVGVFGLVLRNLHG